MSKIEWTESTWNPVTGCSKISPGCANCYAYSMAKRLKAMGNIRYKNSFKVSIHDDLIEKPFSWKKGRVVFVNSMADLFHENVPISFIKKIFFVMNKTPQHIYQILTKRSERLQKLAPELNWTPNIWQGVSVENDCFKIRIKHLECTPATVKFISFEPLIGPINSLFLKNIDWVIVGGESGPKARPIKIEWVRLIRDYCIENEIPFFFKQWGGVRKDLNGRTLDNKIWNQLPSKLSI